MNTALNATNESQATALICNVRVKAQWQTLAARFTKAQADATIAKQQNVTLSAVKAARYYW